MRARCGRVAPLSVDDAIRQCARQRRRTVSGPRCVGWRRLIPPRRAMPGSPFASPSYKPAPPTTTWTACVAKAIAPSSRKRPQQGAQLAAFGETFFPGYPVWLDYGVDYARWDHAPTKQLYARLVANSVAVDGPELRAALSTARRQHGIVLLLGINEKVTCRPAAAIAASTTASSRWTPTAPGHQPPSQIASRPTPSRSSGRQGDGAGFARGRYRGRARRRA